MPQTRDTAPQQPAANAGAPPVTETRVDAAHSIGDAVSAPLLADLSLAELPLADIPLADIAVEQAISELARVEGSVNLRGQADQLAAHLRERQGQLEHRESQVNARVAAFEQEVREARAWLARRNDELNEREARVEARETAIKTPDVSVSSPASLQTETVGGVAKALPTPAATLPPAAADAPQVQDAPYTKDESGLAAHRLELTEPRAEPPLFDAPVSFGEPVFFDKPVSFAETVSSGGPLGETEWAERKRTLVRVGQQIDRRRQALEELHNEISQMHHEALELHLVTQELQAQLRPSLGIAAEERLQAARDKVARRYQKEAAQLIRQRKELECLRSELAKEHVKLVRRYQELKGWIESQRVFEVAGKLASDRRGARTVT